MIFFMEGIFSECRTIYNSSAENREVAIKAVKLNYFVGEAKTMLSHAITSLYNDRSAGIDENQSRLNVVINQIGNFAKASYYLGTEFKNEVTSLSHKMYKNIVSNVYPYYETSYWTSSYGDVTCHLHKDAEAYKFLSSGTYKNAIAFGKVTNVVAPLVSNIMTQYVVYQKYITNKPNVFNNNTVN